MSFVIWAIAFLATVVVMGVVLKSYIRRRVGKAVQKEKEVLRYEIDLTRSRIDVDPELVLQFATDSVSDSFLSVYSKKDPLITICVATYNRGPLLIERCIKSLLAQTYKNIEIVIVGDCCTDETEALMAGIEDSRVRFENLAERGKYPPSGLIRWMVAGTSTVNRALELARGDFICHCDDDDEFLPDKVEKLVKFICAEKAHFVWHPFFYEGEDGKWSVNPAPALAYGNVTTSVMFYHSWLKRVPWDINAWRFGEPGDWNRVRRMKYIGIEALRYSEPLLRHYRERNQKQS